MVSKVAVIVLYGLLYAIPSGISSAQTTSISDTDSSERTVRIAVAVKRAADSSVTSAERLRRLYDLLREETADPVPGTAGGSGFGEAMYTPSEMNLLRIINAIAQVGDVEQIRLGIANETNPSIADSLILARTFTQARHGIPAEKGDFEELKQQLIRDGSAFSRAMCLRALMEITYAQPAHREAVVEVVRPFLSDNYRRGDNQDPQRDWYMVREAARECLDILGVTTQLNPDGTYRISGDDRDAWIELREAVLNGGYTVVWDQAERRADVTKGTHMVRLWADRSEAEVNGRMVPLERKPVVAAGRLVIPRSFVPHLVPKAP